MVKSAHTTPRPAESKAGQTPSAALQPTADGATPQDALISRHAEALLGDPRLGSRTAGQRARLLQRLQNGAGNAYVSRLVQRAIGADAPPAPASAPRLEPRQDPKFVAVEQKIGQTGAPPKQHP